MSSTDHQEVGPAKARIEPDAMFGHGSGPPRRTGPLAKRDMRLAYLMLLPTFAIVVGIVLGPLLANFWIAFKPVTLADLRPPTPLANEQLRPRPKAAGDEVVLRYRVRNSSQKEALGAVRMRDVLPAGLVPLSLDPRCALDGRALDCDFGTIEAKGRFNLEIPVRVEQAYLTAGERPRATKPVFTADAPNVLTSLTFTLDNFRRLFASPDFWDVMWVSMVYTVGGTAGALVLGLFAAQILNTAFAGRNVLRGLFLFPYVAPVIAVAFAWVLLLDAGPGGTLNALLMRMGATDGPINFLGQRYVPFDVFGATFRFPLALATVIVFESWRYFPLAFLFILARMQSVSSEMYEAAEMDGATPLQQFWRISLPQLAGILAVLFLLRFIWTFNKFDDIFLLTGGAAGTRTLTVDVYEQAFAVSNLGAGAAVAVVVFFVLVAFALIFFRLSPKDEA